MPRQLYRLERDPVTIVQEDEWAPEPIWTGAKNLGAIGIRSQDRTVPVSRHTILYTPMPIFEGNIFDTAVLLKKGKSSTLIWPNKQVKYAPVRRTRISSPLRQSTVSAGEMHCYQRNRTQFPREAFLVISFPPPTVPASPRLISLLA
jgi:hypothetical protein